MNPGNKKKNPLGNAKSTALEPISSYVAETANEKLKKYLWGLGIIAALTVPGFLLRQALDTSTIAMFYMLGVVGIAFWWDRGPAIAASFLSALALDYFITQPYYSFAISNPQAWISLFVMLVESLVISALATKSRQGEVHRIAAETEKTRSALLSAVSHDLRTPLTAIEGAASSLITGKDLGPEERSKLCQMIFDEAERMNRLVQNLLDMTRLGVDAPRLKKEWQSMEELVGTALGRLKNRLANHPFTLDLQPGLPLILVDGLLVEQLLLNLLENALNHTAEGTLIRLGVKVLDDAMELEIADQGPGIKAGEEKMIFEKFTRGYHGDKGGSGLGLSICRAIVQAHGGTIGAQNRPEGGASFVVRLPIGGLPPVVSEE